MSVRIATGLMLLLALAVPPTVAQSTDIKFVGQSRATPLLKRDILTAVTGYSKARHWCDSVTKIYTATQPLFTLTKQGNAIATTWQGYSKNDVDTAGPPTFRKQAAAR